MISSIAQLTFSYRLVVTLRYKGLDIFSPYEQFIEYDRNLIHMGANAWYDWSNLASLTACLAQ